MQSRVSSPLGKDTIYSLCLDYSYSEAFLIITEPRREVVLIAYGMHRTFGRFKIIPTVLCNVHRRRNSVLLVKSKKVREPGVEPGSIAWKATMLPLYHSRCSFFSAPTSFMTAMHGHPFCRWLL